MNVTVAERALQLKLEDLKKVLESQSKQIQYLTSLLRDKNELLYDIKSLIEAKGVTTDSMVSGSGWDDYSRLDFAQKERLESYGEAVYSHFHPKKEGQ